MTGCLINGEASDRIGANDRGLQYGDGVFETLLWQQSQVWCWPLHLARLRAGCERLALPFDAYDKLPGEIAQLGAGEARCLLKLIVTRGPAERRGYRPTGTERCNRILTRHPWPGTGLPEAGCRLGISSVVLGNNPQLAGVKHLNRLEQVLAQARMDVVHCDEVLMLADGNGVMGGSMSNIFFADRGGVFTPALEQCGVAGVTRAHTLMLAQRLGIAVQVRRIESAELQGVRAACVSNVRWGLQPVATLEGRALQRSPLLDRLMGEIDAARA